MYKKNTNMAYIDTSRTAIEDVFVTARGSKIAKIRYDGGGDLVFKPPCNVRVPFEPSTFDKDPNAQRLNLVLEIADPDVEATLRYFDSWIVDYVTEHCERILKKSLTRDQVAAGYSSCLRNSRDGYPPTLKTKIDLSGPRRVTCWDADGNQTQLPDSWRSVLVRPALHITHVFMMAGQWGAVMQLTDARVVPRTDAKATPEGPRVNPFK